MQFLERLADSRIQEAIERGDLDGLPGAGRFGPNLKCPVWPRNCAGNPPNHEKSGCPPRHSRTGSYT
ncbi:MAG: DnaJ family domain-containing protein [Methylococcales bacterium]